ncbi:MAG TPA: DoxX family protein [Kofleriaceae bacterium]|nr:DoxX family protein [Kofleriaceae bacterium]
MDATLDTIAPASASTAPKARRWPGRVLTGIPVAFLVFDVVIKFAQPAAVAEATAKLGLPANSAPLLGVILAACLALYVIARTAPLGAVLLTGYLGGAVLTHLRVGDPLISHTLFPIYVGALLWAGLYLRDERVRRLLAAR